MQKRSRGALHGQAAENGLSARASNCRRDGCADLIRLVRGERGRVELRMELVIRFEDGSIIPWVRRLDDGRHTAVAGPDRLTLDLDAFERRLLHQPGIVEHPDRELELRLGSEAEAGLAS